ncbi:hypothetical protein ACAG26_09935 [Mycobacterium sp. pUA109]|uniref:hypothetical protein n=1 Tax=Mycobacterium sp. pUA109 TaxID=3238982 RepID=UPI00351B6A53
MVLWIAALVNVLALAGCGAHHNGAASSNKAPEPSTTTTTPEGPRAGSGALPEGFPADVPVVKGTVAGKYVDIPGSSGGKVWNLTVTGIDAAAYDEADRLLVEGGFARAEPGESEPSWSRHPCDRESQFTKDTADGGSYVVHLCGRQPEPGYQLEYDVNVYPKVDWQLPSLPQVPGGPQPPSVPQVPAGPQPPSVPQVPVGPQPPG